MSPALVIVCAIVMMAAAVAATIYLCIDDIKDYSDMCKKVKE